MTWLLRKQNHIGLGYSPNDMEAWTMRADVRLTGPLSLTPLRFRI